MRKWILRIHLYGGLLCSSYLILFGISSLLFNHEPKFAKPREQKVTWERAVSPGKCADNAARAVRDELGLNGWRPSVSSTPAAPSRILCMRRR